MLWLRFRRLRRRVRFLFFAIGILVIALIVLAVRARAAEQAAPAAGPAYAPTGKVHTVGVIEELDLHDAARNKDLPVKIYYPKDGGLYPVVVFSHGAGGSKDVGERLLSYWASHGYVVIAPTHEDSIALRRAAKKDARIGGIIREFGRDPRVRLSRVEDDRLVIDSLARLPELAPELKGKIDAGHVGVGGHSAGAMTAMLIGGTRGDMPINGPGGPEAVDLRDPRVRCILVLSGQGISPAGGAFNKDSWKGVSLPMMVATGSLDVAPTTGQTPQSRCDPYTYAPVGGKYLLFLEGATHMSFTGKLGGGENPDERLGVLLDRALGMTGEQVRQAQRYDQGTIFSWVEQYTLAFLDAHLRGDKHAQAWLDACAKSPLGGMQVRFEAK